MELSRYFVNFNYETQLFDGKLSTDLSSPIWREMEFLYFYMQKNPSILCTTNSYQSIDFELWSQRGCVIPNIDTSLEKAEGWWGSLENLELERVLNSKKTSFQVIKSLDFLPHDCQLLQRDELPRNFEGKILKGLHGYSGAANYLPPFNIDKVRGEEFIVEPYFSVKLNLGHFINTNKIQHYLILNRPSGSFMGGIHLSSDTLDSLLKCFGCTKEELEEKVHKIFEEYKKFGSINYLQVDSFIYEEEDKFKLYIGHDIQHRKTMGSFLMALKDYFSTENYLWLNFSKGQFHLKGSVELGHTQKKWSSIYAALNSKTLTHLNIVNDVNNSYNKLCSDLAKIIINHED
jgi:hypothetical protein